MDRMKKHTVDALPPLDVGVSEDDKFEVVKSPSEESGGTAETKVASGESSSDEGHSSDEESRAGAGAGTARPTGCSARWSALIKSSHLPIMKGLLAIARVSAYNPLRTITAVVGLSVLLACVGFFTNFNIETSENKLWNPAGSVSAIHEEYLRSGVDFPGGDRYMICFIHANGDNVVNVDHVSKVFDVMDTLRNQTDYDDVCAGSDRTSPDGIRQVEDGQNATCEISGIPAFWAYERSIFDRLVETDEDVVKYLSLETYPDFRPVSRKNIMGKARFDNETGVPLITYAESYTLAFLLPTNKAARDWELPMVDVVLDIKEQWIAEGSNLRVEMWTESSFNAEFTRTIVNDLPLIPVVFLVMSGFTAFVFSKRHKVESRSVLGIAAVLSVLFSVMSGYGLLFIIGVPFTSMTQLLPFLIFGIGLDDAFIVSGAYIRTDPRQSPEERILETIEEIGMSIFLTTVTSATAFGLGCLSSVPAVVWLVLYAFPAIIFVFLYQLTFFVACIVMDERRMAAGRRDICCWIKATDTHRIGVHVMGQEHIADRFMAWMGEMILRPAVKVLVLVLFLGFAGVCAWRATLLRQSFSIADVLPDDSYLREFLITQEAYTDEVAVSASLYFRFVDQSDEEVQNQMFDFIDTMVALDQVSKPPRYFWLDHFQQFVNDNSTETDGLPFNTQLDLFLEDPVLRYLHYDSIYRDDMGNVIASKTSVTFDNVGNEVVEEEVEALADQREATRAFPPNEGKGADEWPFFAYTGTFNAWEFYTVCVNELILTTIVGVVSVTAIGTLIIPHWTAGPIVLPFICILYVDLLGVLQMAGISINAVSYIGLTMSIGLLVDFIMHCLLRYYEVPGNRKEKCIEMLRTMGASILLGGISTFLGTMLLVFASSDIFYTIFIVFFGIVVLGVTHGLILLPVVLSIIGPEDQVTTSVHKKAVEYQEPLGKKVLIYM